MKNIVSSIARAIKSGTLFYRRDTEGAVAVEFALTALMFLALIFSTIEVGRLLFTWNAVQYTIEQAARVALVTEDVTEAQIRQFIADEMPSSLVRTDDLAITVTYSTVSGIDFVEIQGLYDYRFITPFMASGWSDLELPASSRMVLP